MQEYKNCSQHWLIPILAGVQVAIKVLVKIVDSDVVTAVNVIVVV